LSTSVALGFRAGKGGSVVVGVALEKREPRVVLSTRLATAEEGDRLSLEPYHVAFEIAQKVGAHIEATAAVAKGRKRQDKLAAKNLNALIRQLEKTGYKPVVAALLVNRAGWITDLLQYSLGTPEHPPVAEGLAVRDALRFAFRKTELEVAEIDEKLLPETASKALTLSPASIDARIGALGVTAGKPWRKEQKLACLAAWLTIATR
jgi:hypothetical protein